MTTVTIHPGARSISTSPMKTAATSSLSASGSRSLPRFEVSLRLRER
jgi:hypothetical protein